MVPKIVPFHFGETPTYMDESVSISCSISTGDLPINITWFLNGKNVRAIEDIITSNLGKRVSSLAIDTVGAKHAGNFTCLAQNEAGNASYTAELIVNGLFPNKKVLINDSSFFCTIMLIPT